VKVICLSICDAYAMFYGPNSSFPSPSRNQQLHAPVAFSAGLRGRIRPIDAAICICNHAGTHSPQQHCKNSAGERSTDGVLVILCSRWPLPHPYTAASSYDCIHPPLHQPDTVCGAFRAGTAGLIRGGPDPHTILLSPRSRARSATASIELEQTLSTSRSTIPT
jgi:hypothetical protein